MDADKNRKRANNLRWIGFQSILAGIVIIFGVGCLCFISLGDGTGSQSTSHLARRGLGLLLLCGVWGLWMIVRGVIYLIRAQTGDEHYAKHIEDVMGKIETKHASRMKKNAGNYSGKNVLVLLGWIFLFLAVVGAIAIGYLYWMKPR